jgi:hypothetical protein
VATALTLYEISRAGDSKAYAAADATGNTLAGNDGRVFLHFKNTNAAVRNVTVAAAAPCNRGTLHNAGPVTIAATTGDQMIGPFPVDWFGGTLTITYDAATNLTVAALHLPSS